jgi:mannonate dehydratase
MKMTLRWFGPGQDSVTLEEIRQIPGVQGVITALHEIPVGEAWSYEQVMERKALVEAAGLKLLGIESINVHEDIKLGIPSREQYIENYIKSLEAVGKADIHMVCYNFMPIFDWMRTDLTYMLEDGSNSMAYDDREIIGMTPEKMFARIEENSNGYIMPGWELNRKAEITDLFHKYEGMTAERLRENYKYFLDAIMPTCEKYEIKMAVHPDDPAWNVFGLPRIVTCEEDMLKILDMNTSIYNGFSLCTGSLGSSISNNLPTIIRNPRIAERIHFAHVRNLKFTGDRLFHESAHLSECGSFDMYEIMKALIDGGFDGIIRPDHGRNIWGEVSRPGYGLYDRALGAVYLQGLEEAIKKSRKE